MKRALLLEGLFATAGLVLVTRLLKSHPLVFAILCVYGPLLVLWLRKRRMALLETRIRDVRRGLQWFGISAAIVFPPFCLAAAGWQTWVMGLGFTGVAAPPGLSLVATHLLLVAVPEEFFFRGYLQSTWEAAFPRRVRLFGAPVGWGWVLASAVFAIAHSVVHYQWWHFAIVFPALCFGFLRARTGGLTAPILFHAASNVLMDWLARSFH